MVYSIHQPNFIPWIGYFHKILCSDRVIFFDSVQISSGKSYTSRVKILLNGNEHWLSMPVKKAGNFGQLICETEILDYKINWRKILGTIKQAYAKSPFFREVFPMLESFTDKEYVLLVDLNIDLIKTITVKLGGEKVEFLRSSTKPELLRSESRLTDYIIETCNSFGIKDYMSGKGGSAEFLEREKFVLNDIKLSFQEFKHPVYHQTGCENFVPGLSIVDALMNLGFSGTREAMNIPSK